MFKFSNKHKFEIIVAIKYQFQDNEICYCRNSRDNQVCGNMPSSKHKPQSQLLQCSRLLINCIYKRDSFKTGIGEWEPLGAQILMQGETSGYCRAFRILRYIHETPEDIYIHRRAFKHSKVLWIPFVYFILFHLLYINWGVSRDARTNSAETCFDETWIDANFRWLVVSSIKFYWFRISN